jgi:LysM repeat protein
LGTEGKNSRYLVCFIKPKNKKVSKILRSILSFFVLFGTLFVPIQVVQASFFSSLFVGQTASADSSENTVTPPQPGDNSQNSSLALQVSSSSQVGSKKDSSSSQVAIDNTGTAIVSPVGPMGVSDGTDTSSVPTSNDTSVYVVRDGDNIATIAKMFGVSVDTILWANDMKKGEKLTTGEVLLILPVSGVEYTIKKGDKLQNIANHYKVDVNDIIQNNDITLDTPLVAGDTLIIPNAEEESAESSTPIPAKDLGKTTAKNRKYYEQHPVKNLASYYVDPVPGYRLSQGIHDNNAVDLAVPRGTPVHAAASGTVTFAKLANNGGFGGLVIISHPNGTETLYAHLSDISTHIGENVSQNDVIASSGGVPGTPYCGHSTGAHLHFEVHGAHNPGADDSWKN